MILSCVLFLISVTLLSFAEVIPCDSNWHYNNKTGACYKTSTEMGTWFDGAAICERMHKGAQLASLRTEEESKFVAKVHRNGLDGIHAWTGLSQTKTANNWTFTDGSKPWFTFVSPYLFPSNLTSCVEILDNWLNELFQNSGKTQPIFCYHYRKALCKYYPAPLTPIKTTVRTPAARIEKAHPRSVQSEIVSGCSAGTVQNQGADKKPSNAGPVSTSVHTGSASNKTGTP
ncbi:hypothetical protein L5515_011585 [Caenorhabditis briggsae]|uniref:C-type lectin domain-containing protein n=1 Tax=Caenorhabditis briggsae TaxID=6238 RepID=A0AAE9EUC8_CAEBR|nr:hypothetical protein L5515_011585 [Caenorhabditis briggsae]